MNIVFLDTRTVGDVPNLDDLRQFGEVKLYPVTKPEETAGRISSADIVITNKVVLNRSILQQAKQLKLVCVAATGMNNIDRKAAKKLKIPVQNVEGYATASVAQSTFAMILQLIQNIPYYDEYVKSGIYSDHEIFTHVERDFHEIEGKRFGIIGLGNIGSRVAQIAEAFGADVAYYSTSGRNDDQPYRRLSLQELLTTSDIVSIHAPLNENTENLITFDQLKQMKRSSILVNTGRGKIVDEQSLARALDENLLFGAALDVFEHEPIEIGNPLLENRHNRNLILTPHMAWSSVEARTALIDGVCKNIYGFIEGLE